MASIVSNMRRTAIGAVVFVFLVVEFAAQGGPADKTSALVNEALQKRPAEEQNSSAPAASATARPVSGAKSWFAPSSDEESLPPPPPPANDWGTTAAPRDPNAVYKAPPRGVDFPENR